MPGGLIQIVAYGAQDLFLTGIPEITFFKYIYKRYTNFAMDFIELTFDGDKNFGEDISCNIPKDGDLLKDLILKLTLPNVKLEKNTDNTSIVNTLKSEMLEKESIYLNFNNFIKYIYESIKIINIGLVNLNETFSTIQTSINSYINSDSNYLSFKNKVSTDIQNMFDIINHLININNISTINDLEKKILSETLVNSYISRIESVSKIYFDEYIEKKNNYNLSLQNNYDFSWIKNLGYNIISQVELDIGGNIIDRQYGIWLYIWNELFENHQKKNDMNNLHSRKLISYTYNKESKPQFDIYVPLKFFFNRDYGLSLPLISLRYQSIILKIKIEKLNNLIYTNYDKNNISNIIKLNNVTLLANYIYLDQDERSKFAQANHEYLIEQVKYFDYDIIKNKDINIELNFNHPIKYYIWTIQNKKDILNYNLFNNFESDLSYTLNNKYPTLIKNVGNPINNAQLQMNGVDRTTNHTGDYYNYITSYETNINTPADGINFYSFSLNPNKIQPSGTCNFSRLSRKNLKLELNDIFLNRLDSTDHISVKIYYVNYNILRFSKGLSNLVFNF